MSIHPEHVPPEPVFVTAELAHHMAYAWACDGHGLRVLGDTRQEARANWAKAYRDEYLS